MSFLKWLVFQLNKAIVLTISTLIAGSRFTCDQNVNTGNQTPPPHLQVSGEGFWLPVFHYWQFVKWEQVINVYMVKKEKLKHHELNQLTVMCTTRGEGRLISIQCQKECMESKLDISCRMMHNWINIYHVVSRVISIITYWTRTDKLIQWL